MSSSRDSVQGSGGVEQGAPPAQCRGGRGGSRTGKQGKEDSHGRAQRKGRRGGREGPGARPGAPGESGPGSRVERWQLGSNQSGLVHRPVTHSEISTTTTTTTNEYVFSQTAGAQRRTPSARRKRSRPPCPRGGASHEPRGHRKPIHTVRCFSYTCKPVIKFNHKFNCEKLTIK